MILIFFAQKIETANENGRNPSKIKHSIGLGEGLSTKTPDFSTKKSIYIDDFLGI
jgi:hypothetical protein